MRVLKSERTAYQQKAVNYFRGQDLCDFLMESKNLTIPEAVRKSQDLLDGNIGHPLSGVDQIYDPKRIYQIQESEDGDVLNAGKTYCDEISAGAFNHELVQILDSIYDKILSPDRRKEED
ncbi:hypothetical protein L596_005037 [Steinernema carpocapsae]|uniref:Uncharacterized protein n=1 Tax=Steinernema carpocapsae TaxID=34508 RepID=A0A4U8UXQ5_STECR|nr:hypothetical protein L596_005037 [Steinernema carpocapsae]